MRSQNRTGLSHFGWATLAVIAVTAVSMFLAAAYAQEIVPRLTGSSRSDGRHTGVAARLAHH
jgi:hypothetical protein